LAVLAGLAGISVAAWVYVVATARRMAFESAGVNGQSMAPTMEAMTGVQPWTVTEFVTRLAMWAAMMVAMMVPTAAPMILLYASLTRSAAAQRSPLAPTFVFVAGYIAMWTAFSVGATLAQYGLEQASLLTPGMASNSAAFGATLLIVAGIYQFTPLKNACLRYCRAPAGALSRNWRTGTLGALRMGLRFGAYCVGCCWVLMALMFVGGTMNLLWMAAIAVFVLLEKTIPLGDVSGKLAGAAMIAVGVASLAL
jgi:predicted metal-binding membrane protein